MTAVVVAFVVAAVVLASIPLVGWIIDRRAAARRSPPPLLYPMSPADPRKSLGAAHPHPHAHAHAHRTNGHATPQVSPHAAPRSNGIPPTRPQRNPSTSRTEFDAEPSPTDTVRFVRPVDGPVQLLPGRLEVLAGDTHHQEIRFVRIPGQPLQLILGRDGGPSPQYVGLSSSTVSRQHARFGYAGGHWFVTNLSHTNPLVINDDELTVAAGERALVDGDRLELGEVVLRYHAH